MHRIDWLSILLLGAVFLAAEEPNLVRTRILKVGKTTTGSDADLVTTEYNDANEKAIQVKACIDDSKDLVTCTISDGIGRQKYVTKAFVDINHPGHFIPGNFDTINDPSGQLRSQYIAYDGPDTGNDPNAYSEVTYFEDPLSRNSRIRESR